MAINTAHSRKSHRIAASWAGVAAALLATGALATTVVAGGNDSGEQPAPTTTPVDGTDAYVTCMRPSGSETSSPSPTSRSRSTPASPPCSDRTVPGNRRCCGCCVD